MLLSVSEATGSAINLSGDIDINAIVMVVFSCLVAIIAFWLKRFVNEVSKMRELIDSVMREQASQGAACELTHSSLRDELSDIKGDIKNHTAKLMEHSEKIASLQK